MTQSSPSFATTAYEVAAYAGDFDWDDGAYGFDGEDEDDCYEEPNYDWQFAQDEFIRACEEAQAEYDEYAAKFLTPGPNRFDLLAAKAGWREPGRLQAV